jgi:opacity protein-like surface antigen
LNWQLTFERNKERQTAIGPKASNSGVWHALLAYIQRISAGDGRRIRNNRQRPIRGSAAEGSTRVPSPGPCLERLVYRFARGCNGGYSGAGFIGGGQIGYNWQKGNLVLGLEGDISGLSGGANGFATSDGTPGKNISAKIRWLSTIRGRMGLAVNDTMAYVTAGVAIGGVKNSLLNVANGLAKSVSKTRVGWAVGGGIEHMWSRNWTIGLEAMFVDLGHSRATFDDAKTTRFSNQAIIGRLKLNYKF